MVIEFRVVQFWSEITRMISDQIALHSVQLPLSICRDGIYTFQIIRLELEFEVTVYSIPDLTFTSVFLQSD